MTMSQKSRAHHVVFPQNDTPRILLYQDMQRTIINGGRGKLPDMYPLREIMGNSQLSNALIEMLDYHVEMCQLSRLIGFIDFPFLKMVNAIIALDIDVKFIKPCGIKLPQHIGNRNFNLFKRTVEYECGDRDFIKIMRTLLRGVQEIKNQCH